MSNRPANLKLWMRRIVILIAIVLAVLWTVQAFVLPPIVGRLVRSQLAAAGYHDATLYVDHVSLTSTTIRDIHSPAGLDVGLLHVTYTPVSLLSGRVDDLAVEDAFARAEAYRPQAASGPSRPPFQRLSVRRTQIELPTPSGPATADVEITTKEREDHRLLLTGEASIPGVRVQATLDADPDMTISDLTARVDADLAAVPALLARDDLAMAGQLVLKAQGKIDATQALKWKISELTLDSNADTLTTPLAEIRGAKIDIRASASGTRDSFAAELLPESQVNIQSVQTGEDLPPFAAVLRPRDLQVSRDDRAWHIRTEGAGVQLGDLQLAFNRGQLTIDQRRVLGRIESSIDLVEVGQSRLLQAMFPLLGRMQLGGTAQLLFVRAAEAGTEGEDLPSLTLRIVNGTLASQEYQLSAEGIQSQIVLVDPANPHTPPAQTLTMSYGQMGEWEVRDALFQFAIADLNTLAVEKTELGWLGGKIWADPYTVTLDSPIIRSRVYGRELDLGKLIWISTGEKAWGEGLVDLDIPVTFSWPKMRFGDGFVAARPGGKLHLDYAAEWLGRYLAATDPRFVTDPTYATVRERVVKALRDFRFSKLRMDMKRKEQHLDTLVQIQGKGDHEGGQEVNLNLTVADLDWLISRYLAMPKTELTTEQK